MAVDQKATIVQVKAAIMKLEIASAVNVECYPDDQHPGYYFLEITSREASVKNAIMDMKARYATDKVIAFGNDIGMQRCWKPPILLMWLKMHPSN